MVLGIVRDWLYFLVWPKKDPELKEIKVELDFGDEINLECDQNEFEPNEDFKGEMITEIIDKLKTMEDKY